MKGLQIPERFTGKIYIMVNSDPESYFYGRLDASTTDYSEHLDDRILVGTVDVDVPLDARGTSEKQIQKLRTTRQRIIEEATEKANQIDEAIESLLAIEHSGS